MFWSSEILCAYTDIFPLCPLERPIPLTHRWEEDWSVLADPAVAAEPFDELKYIPLCPTDPCTYLSLGADWRNRYDYNNAMDFGIGDLGKKQSYVFVRMQAHADLRVAQQLQIFVQLQNDYAPGKTIMLPADEDRLDLEQGFLGVTEPWGTGIFSTRVGRQQFFFDSQRFVSLRDGANVRLSHDAIWVEYAPEEWRYIFFYSHPVQVRHRRCFDDHSRPKFIFDGLRIKRYWGETIEWSSYLANFKREHVFPIVAGRERRHLLDIRFAYRDLEFDCDLEAMGQIGKIANKKIMAWAWGSLAGYTFTEWCWQPRVGLQFDIASGTRGGNTLRTFNPLFPRGTYFSLAGYTGFTNLIHVKSSVTVRPCENLTVLFGAAAQWRQSTRDAIYVQAERAVPRTVGLPGRHTGQYFQFRLDWQINSHFYHALEIVRYDVGKALKKVGGHDSTFLAAELKFAW